MTAVGAAASTGYLSNERQTLLHGRLQYSSDNSLKVLPQTIEPVNRLSRGDRAKKGRLAKRGGRRGGESGREGGRGGKGGEASFLASPQFSRGSLRPPTSFLPRLAGSFTGYKR